MSSLKSLAHSLAIAAALDAAAAVSETRAADLDLPYADQAPPPLDQNIEFGTGWYIRGSVVGALQTQPSLTPSFTSVPSAQSNNWGLEIGGGYQINKWFRTDVTYTYYGQQQVNANGASVNCPSAINGLYQTEGTTQVPVGVTADGNQCTPHESSSLQKNLILANAYVDLGTWYGVTPYVGGGIGAAYMVSQQSVNYTNNSDGSPYRATLTLPSGYPAVFYSPNGLQQQAPLNPQPHYNYGPQNWDFSQTTTKLNFAFALMAGVAYDITSNAKLDIGYRYVNFGAFSGISSLSGTLFSKQITTQEVHVGIRYMID